MIITVLQFLKKTKKRGTRAQLALEYLFIVGIVLVGIIAIFGKPVYDRFTGDTRIITAQRSVDILAGAADDTYLLGKNNKKCVTIEIPKGVVYTQLAYGEVLLRLQQGNSVNDIVAKSRYQTGLVGVLPPTPGIYSICIYQESDNGAVATLAGATCAANDGCKLYCDIADPDCTNPDNGYVPSLNGAYCGNDVLESGEQCELTTSCNATIYNYTFCNIQTCLCGEIYPGYGDGGGPPPERGSGDPPPPPTGEGGGQINETFQPTFACSGGPYTNAQGYNGNTAAGAAQCTPRNCPTDYYCDTSLCECKPNPTTGGGIACGTEGTSTPSMPQSTCENHECPPNQVCKASKSFCACVPT